MYVTEYQSGTLSKSFDELQHIPKLEFNSINYSLPPSKSHMIRILALAAINQRVCNIRLNGILGDDIESMIYSLQSIGVNITKQFDKHETIVTIYGVGEHGFSSRNQTVDCGNSGTALRIVMGLISSMREEITLFGDESLSKRFNESMINSLQDADIFVEKTTDSNLPLRIKGPWFGDSEISKVITLDCSKSSQPLSSWMISSSLFPCNVDLKLLGPTVSNRHYLLTKELCNKYGADISATDDGYRLNRWEVSLPDEITIPGDSSMVSFAILLCKLHACKLKLSNWPKINDALGNEILQDSAKYLGISWDNNAIECLNNAESASYDLRDCNDLITPLAVIISLGGGGEIIGISHTVFKESNRIQSTLELMDNFGLKAIFDGKKIIIEGGQEPVKPTLPVNCHNDHRLFMTAAILMTKYGGDLIGKGLHKVADFDFLNRLGI
jgi:3-phosphoshikimate 1-carboxyvinyltransferase